MTTRSHRSLLLKLLAVLFSFALLASACGDDSDDGGGDDTGDDTGDGGSGDDDSGDDDSGDDGDDGGEAAPAGDPVYGGELSFLVEAETTTWDLPNAECATSCINVFRLTSDAYFATDSDQVPQPMLLESAVPNEDFSEWTFVIRPDITFSDGTPLDAAAVKRDLDEKKASLLHGQVFSSMTSVDIVDDMTVTVSFDSPFADLPYWLTERPGFVMAPAFWDDPDRTANGPIGTGPFIFSDWIPDDRLILEANPNYWRKDAEGRDLPYLDRVVIRPVPGQTDREAIMQAGDASIAQISNSENPQQWEDWDAGLLRTGDNKETSYLQFNNAAPPFDDIRARQAIAYCSDLETFNQIRNPSATTANGPFAPGTIGYLEETGQPTFDPAAGTALVDELGGLSVDYLTTNDPGNLLNAQFLTEQWSAECGIDATINQIDQGQLITVMLTGDVTEGVPFNLIQTRNHGAPLPSSEYIWWNSQYAEGSLPLNFSRFQDPDIDAALDGMRATVDPAELTTLAEDLNSTFGEQTYNLWYAWTEWLAPYQANVENVGTLTLPDGGVGFPFHNGNVWATEAWLNS